MKLQITFLDESVVEISLFQNNAVAKWFKHFQKINLNYKISSKDLIYRNGIINSSKPWNQIKSAIDKLKQINYTFPFSISDEFDRSQDTLNQLHRFFTYNVLWYHDLHLEPDKKNPFDENFKIPEYMSFQQWLDIVDEINVAVHQLEPACHPHKNKKFILDQHPLSMIICNTTRKSHTDLDPWLQFTVEDQAHNFDEYMALESPMVILNDSILGKSVLQSFYENDDPNAQDCTGRLGSFGGFVIELDGTRKNIYRSPEFTSWARSHNRALDSLPLEFPIGYISNFENQRSTLLQKIKIYKNTKFID
jgi:hypothetical protein